ncbi:MAG TPA: tetratricopeptide repeat protein [Gammaproteobacteria bacterium]|nr:tetratricopeptide repeat protein [Gammaproteobacteria bacterium]
MQDDEQKPDLTPQRRRYVPAVGPKLRKVLFVVFGLFALLAINSVYLGGMTLVEWASGETYQDYFYQFMFLGHLVLGLLVVLPLIVYGIIHITNAHDRPNRRAVKVGYALFATALVLLASGLVLTRGIPFIEVRDPAGRELAYWAHVVTPLAVVWLFVLHRLAGKRINWRAGAVVAGVAGIFALAAILFQAQDPRRWNEEGPASGERYFFPSLARTATGNFIPARTLMKDDYCAECHADVHAKWSHSVHRLASFTNPAYLFSVRKTREFALERDGNVQAARFCAGCHDLVPFFSGAFDDPQFDDVNHPTAAAGITCTGCHAITHVNSPRGNADYTIEEPLHYPFAYSEDQMLGWVNRFLVKAKPALHKKTFLKPLHRTPEFCGTCHKVHLPPELNHYKWLRGQNHYDAYELSGVSGHGIQSFYYPDQAKHNCNGCHMPLEPSDDFGAKPYGDDGTLSVHNHQFVGANTAIPALMGWPEEVIEAHREFLTGSLRVDLIGVKRGGSIEGELIAPLKPDVPELVPGESYLVETVLRTLTLGHAFTEGTADSNEVWVEVTAKSGGRLIGTSGAVDPSDGSVDRWAHFVNAYVIDRDGQRIDRRNPENIFVALYNHQIPPGAADVVHYRLRIPEWVEGPVELEAALRYRKFDTLYMRHFEAEAFDTNDLPVTTIASDRVVFPVRGSAVADPPDNPPSAVPEWQRWNDYGIGLLRKGGQGELRQAEAAFARVEALGRGDGALNLARAYIREGRLDEAAGALGRAARADEPAYPWSVTYFTGVVNMQNGYLDEAIENFRTVVDTRFTAAREREFDFSRDYRLLNELAQALVERSRLERGDAGREARERYLGEAEGWYLKTLAIDPENVAAHYGLAQVYAELGKSEAAGRHRALHARYRIDDNARDRAIALARRRDEAANHAAEAVVIYDLKSEQAPGPERAAAQAVAR